MALSLSPENCRISRACLCWHLDNAQKNVMFFSDCLQKQKKIYMIPCRAIAYHRDSRPFYLLRSLEKNATCRKNCVASFAYPTNKRRRSKKSLDCSNNNIKDLERQLEELFNEVKNLIKMGNKEDALNLLKANYKTVEERMNAGARSMEEAATLDVLALGYMAVGDMEFVAYLLGLLNEIVDSLNDNESHLHSILIHMGTMHSTLEQFEESLTLYRRAITIIETTYGKNSSLIVTPLLGMAKALGSIGRSMKAVEVYHSAISILESSRGSESEDLVIPLFCLGNLLIKEGRTEEGEAPFIRVLNIYKKLYGENDGRVGMVMSTLAQVKCAKGNVEESILLYKNALRIIKDSNYLPLDDKAMEKMRIDLAELLHLVEREEEGRALLEECLLIAEKSKGRGHPSSVTHLINLATSYSRSKHYAESERLLTASLEIMAGALQPGDQSITLPMLNLAVTLYYQRRYKEAEPLALEVLRMREEAFGLHSLPVGEALDCVVSIRMRLKQDDGESLEMLKRVLRIQEEELGHESLEVMLTLKKILYVLDKLGRSEEKCPLQERLSFITKKHAQIL